MATTKPKPTVQQLEELIAAGFTQRQMGEVLNITQTSVRYWLAKYNLNTKIVHGCKCGEKDPAKFHPGRHSQCKACRQKEQRKRHRNNKQTFIDYKGGQCVICGYKDCPASMDFHHRDPDQKDPDWKKMRLRSPAKVYAELDKCVLLCRNCHAEVHYKRDDILSDRQKKVLYYQLGMDAWKDMAFQAEDLSFRLKSFKAIEEKTGKEFEFMADF